MAKRIGLLTGGGDAPGQNVCLKALVYNASDQGYQIVGIRKGWEGLMYYQPENSTTHADNVMILTKSRVRDIDRWGGSFLHSSRLHPGQVPAEAVPAFLQPRKKGDQPVDITDHIKQVLNKLQLDALVVLGDRATLDYAACLSKAGIPVIGIPKTVHNDVNGSDYCLGFSTALSRGVHFIQEIRAMAGSREEVAVVEILGRSTGLTTLIISLLASADRTLIPEVAFDPEALAMLLMDDKRANPASYAILVMSEASSIVPEKAQKYLPELSRLARSRTLAEAMTAQDRVEAEGQIVQDVKGRREIGSHVLGSGAVVTEILENLTGQRFLLQPLSYLLRTGEPDGQDLLGAMNFATLATKLLASGQTGRLIAYRQGANYVDVPLDVVSQPATHINVTDHYDAKLYTPKSSILWAARV